MPPRNNFPIGIHHYIDYLNANVNQLNLYNIPHSRDPNSDDSDPGSPASSHGGDRTAQPALIPVNYGADIEQGSSFPSHVNSLIPSTSSYPRPTSASESSEHGYSASPTGSVRSDQSASLSAHSGYSDYSGQSGSSAESNDPTHRQPAHQLYRRQDDHGPTLEMEHRPPISSARPQHYYRLGDDGHQGVLAPEVLDADADIQGISSQGSSPGSRESPALYTIASSSTSSTPATALRHLPWPSVQPPPFGEAEQYLRHQLSLPRDKPVDLRALKDPPNRGKPSQPYPELIKLAIFGSETKKLTLQEIYKALIDRFEWFKDNSSEMAWKNSIRHNLSLNKVFVNNPRPITEPGKGTYWRLDLSQGEGYKRPRIRKSRAQQREAAQQQAAQEQMDGNRAARHGTGDVSPQTASSSGHSNMAAASIDDANIDPQLRDQGHRVGEKRVRSTSRRTDAISPYPLRKTPSPVLPLATSHAQQVAEPLAVSHSPGSRSGPSSPPQQNPQSRNQGHRDEGRTRPTTRRTDTTSPYHLRKTSSPVQPSVSNQTRDQGHRAGEARVRPTSRRTDTHSRPSSPLQNPQPGHRVGEGRVRPTSRRTDTSSPYPSRQTPSPVLPLHMHQREQQQNVSEQMATHHSSGSHSELLSPLQIPREMLLELSAPVAQPHYGQPPMGQAAPGHSYFVEPSFMPPFGQPSLPPPTLDQTWMPQSTASPAFNAHTSQLSLSSNIAHDSPDGGLEKTEIEYIADHGLPRVRRVPGSNRPVSLSPPHRDDGAREYNSRGPADGAYYNNDGSGHSWNK